MAERECDTCGEVLPAKMFWGKHRMPQTTCTPCRRKEARRMRYDRQRRKELQKEQRLELIRIVKEQDKKMRDTKMYAGVLELNKIISRIDHKIRKYAEKISYCEGSSRTEQALEHQQQRRNYYQEIKDLLYADAKRGVDRDLEYYLSNTYLLHKHGFPVVVTDADPREEHTDGED